MKDNMNKYMDLEQKNADLELAINSSYDALHLIDADGHTILINDACGIHEGLYRDQIEGKTIWQLLDEGFLSESVTLKVLDQKKTVTMIQRVKNGKDMLVTGTPIFDDDDKISKVMVNSRDITELNFLKKQLSETEMKYRTTEEQLRRSINNNLPSEIICQSTEMKKVIDAAVMVSAVESNILVTGESGVGKGVISKFIHDKSKRSEKPFIKIDCGSIPEALFESEMFGYEKGAFTGANTDGKIGLMELAHGGTLFLDEIGEISLYGQSKLLRAIQDKEIIRLGGNDVIKIDIRVIAATNRDLREMVKNQTFREDLFYRLNVIPIHIPPLRDRPEDTQELILRLIKRINKEYSFKKHIDLSAMECLISYPWKGNVRELENVVERILVTTQKDVVTEKDLPSEFYDESIDLNFDLNGENIKSKINQYEAKLLENLIKKGKTPIELAELYEANVSTIRRKLNKYNIKFK